MCIMYMQELGSTEEATASSGIGLQAIVNSRRVLGTGTVSSTRAVSALNNWDPSPASRELVPRCKAGHDTDMVLVVFASYARLSLGPCNSSVLYRFFESHKALSETININPCPYYHK